MAARAEWLARAQQLSPEQRAKIGHEAIVSDHQLVELPAGRRILIFEALRLARHGRAEQLLHQLVVEAREFAATAREKTNHRRIAVIDVGGPRRTEWERRAGAALEVDALGARALSAHGPELVGEPLLRAGDLGLHG